MKIFYALLFTLFFSLSLNADGFWTLTGLKKSNIYVQQELTLLKPETLQKIKDEMEKTLTKHGILINQQDSATLMLSLEELAGDEGLYYIYLKLSLGEDVQTFRKNREATFALTFHASDFIETDESNMQKDILESLRFLLNSFSELYEEDNE